MASDLVRLFALSAVTWGGKEMQLARYVHGGSTVISLAAGLIVSTLGTQVSARPYAYAAPPPAHYYTNVDGHRVHRPVASRNRPVDASAHCADGTWSFSEHRRGTCSHHGGVIGW